MEQKAISSDLIRGHIDTIILHTLLSSDKHAQQISDAIEEKSQNQYKINQATLYSSLKRLETLKFATSYWNDADGGRRKFFKLTADGKNYVDENLSSWSYSRSVIDKLMDCQPEPIYQTKIIEKIVERPVIVEQATQQQTTEEKQLNAEQNVAIPQPQTGIANEKTQTTATLNDTQEINFRSILNGLVQFSRKNAPVEEIQEQTETQGIVLEPIVTEKEEQLKFTQTINEIDYNNHRSNNGKIDFGDLAIKAEKEGYKIKISSKDSPRPQGSLLINKLNLFTSLFLYLIMLIETLVFTTRFKVELNVNMVTALATVGFVSLFPLIYLFKYLANPKRCTVKKVSGDSILTASIIVFNLLLITLAVSLLSNVDFTDLRSLLLFVVTPTVLFFDILIYFVAKLIFSKSNYFKFNKNKKTA